MPTDATKQPKANLASCPPIRGLGANWHRGAGAKASMQADATIMNARAQLQLQDPFSGWRQFGCYKEWKDANEALQRLKGHARHAFEIIPFGKKCKPYLDIDGPPLPNDQVPFPDVAALVAHTEDAIKMIFSNDYGIQIDVDNDLIWLISPNAKKLSLHLIIDTKKEGTPLHVYSSNHQADPSGASNLAMRLQQLDPNGVGKLVDKGVYTKDREMRMLGSCKFNKDADSVLVPLKQHHKDDPDTALRTVISNVPEDAALIQVPEHIPRYVKKNGIAWPARPRTQTVADAVRSAGSIIAKAVEKEPHVRCADIIVRMLDLLRRDMHPSAFHDRRPAEDAFDRAVGIRFNYSDRSEPCYTGNIHDGEQNMRCFVDTAGNCIVKCFSATCDNHAPACIGRLAEPGGDEWDAGAIRVKSRYIDIDACLEMKQAVDVWLDPERKDVNTLSVRSPMGSGKSTMLDALLERVGEDKTVLVVTYRQSLALEHKRKLARRGFVSYLDADVTPQDLRQRDKTPRVICQIESLHKLAKHTCMRYLTSGFDIVVLDEIESLLRHFMSPTVVNPLSEIQGLADTLNAATTGVVTMDATWGSVTKDFLKQAGLRNLLVINDYRSTENARTFAISKDEATWSAQIRDDIIAGRNVVVVSLSQERAMQVHKAALDTFDDPKDAARLCLLHTSKTADAVKAMLIDVDALWSSKRVVIYTPTISAGVDFSTEHFDRMYLYLCPGSAAPMGALQMTGRVRHLVDTDVRTLVAKNMRVAREATRQHLTHVDLYQWLRCDRVWGGVKSGG
jgi:hypothetical protein